ncbi:MAG TPA: phosphoribosyltransferase family protein [Ottowia sp.]|uniref:phosphoribosyltransferase family protein n=1 Tax=Ottowia sp. TaxID=1898956 RepID=UPI002BA257F2|nr:phosphoribosyltransferase family protein [Ottowia sp.]HMN22440.1 phosphoribosyltransferase family protein [Ottowia sp.]
MALPRLLPALFSPAAWPSQCLICRAWPARSLCPDCTARFTRPVPRCSGCALPVPAGVPRCGACLVDPPPIDACLAAVDYAWPWTHCIARLKFHQDVGLAAALAALLAAAPGVPQALAHADWLLPMPLAPERLAERGYNPALLLARQLPHASCRTDLLLRMRHTPPQRGLSRAARRRNVRGAFAVEAVNAQALQGRHVALLDDVMTTGASLHEAARALRRAGARRITAIALARTDAPR